MRIRSETLSNAAQTLLELAAKTQADTDHAHAKIDELLETIKGLRASLANREKSIANRETRIVQLRAEVAYHKTHTLRYQKDLAECRSLLRKTKPE